MRSTTLGAAALALTAALVCAAPAAADSWAPPRVETYAAEGGQARFTATPRAMARGQKPGAPQAATGVLEVRRGGRWVVAWRRELVNEIAPAHALVAADGAHVVTFDDWASVGRGLHVVAIYDAEGDHVRSLSLADLIPADWEEALPGSVSSTRWDGEHRLSEDGERLLLQILVPSPDDEAEPTYVELPVRLADGAVLTPTDAAWTAAAAQATRTVEAHRAAVAAADAAFVAPLTPPSGAGELEWHAYLREAFSRVDPDWADSYPITMLLHASDAADYAASETSVRDALTARWPARWGKRWPMMIASTSSPDHLATTLERLARAVKPGALKGVRVYVAAPGAEYARAAAALAASGATVVQLDPATPIPQRKERLEQHGLAD